MARAKSHKGNHKYHRIPINGEKLWACALPQCSHYMGKHIESMMLGRGTICWSCGTDMLLDEDNLKKDSLDRPICIGCANPELLSVLDDVEANKDL